MSGSPGWFRPSPLLRDLQTGHSLKVLVLCPMPTEIASREALKLSKVPKSFSFLPTPNELLTSDCLRSPPRALSAPSPGLS